MKQIVVVVFGFFCVMMAAPAWAGCYKCGTDLCCADATIGTTGKKYCNSRTHCGPMGCYCWDCTTHGTSCTGTASGGGNCDENDGTPGCVDIVGSLLTPNGEAIKDLDLATLATALSQPSDEGSSDPAESAWPPGMRPAVVAAECTSG